MTNFVSATARACYFHLSHISQIRRYLTTEATAKLVVSLILSRSDYCNSLFSGLPDSTIHTLQCVQNNDARLVLKIKKSDHTTPLLKSLHWLPVHLRIHFKVLSLCYKSLNNSDPIYLSNSLHLNIPSRSLLFAQLPTLSACTPLASNSLLLAHALSQPMAHIYGTPSHFPSV